MPRELIDTRRVRFPTDGLTILTGTVVLPIGLTGAAAQELNVAPGKRMLIP